MIELAAGNERGTQLASGGCGCGLHLLALRSVVSAVVARLQRRRGGVGDEGARPKLRRLLGDARVGTIVVEHRDRLARLGSEYIEAALLGAGRRLVVVDAAEVEDDLVRDMTEVLTSLCARLYGRRSARTRAQRALRCAAQPVAGEAA